MQKDRITGKIFFWLMVIITIISYLLMTLKSGCILHSIPFKSSKVVPLQNFSSNAAFLSLLHAANPEAIHQLINYYKIDYLFMVGFYGLLGYSLLSAISIYMRYMNRKKGGLKYALIVILIGSYVGTVLLDIAENIQLIYQARTFSVYIEELYYPLRFRLKFYFAFVVIIAVLLSFVLKRFKKDIRHI
ncbi:hypothetical protein [Niabella aquatica]